MSSIEDTGEPLPCRIHLKNASGRPVRVPHMIAWGDHFVCDGNVKLKLPVGSYTFLIERGLEYLEMRGGFRIETFADDSKTIELHRFCNMAKEGWYAGDFDAARPEKDLPLIMRADDLYVVPLTTFTRAKNPWLKLSPPKHPLVQVGEQRSFNLFSGEDELAGGTLGYLNLEKPFAPRSPGARAEILRKHGDQSKSTTTPPPASTNAKRELPLLDHVAEARNQKGAWIDAQASTGWRITCQCGSQLGHLEARFPSVLNRQFLPRGDARRFSQLRNRATSSFIRPRPGSAAGRAWPIFNCSIAACEFHPPRAAALAWLPTKPAITGSMFFAARSSATKSGGRRCEPVRWCSAMAR